MASNGAAGNPVGEPGSGNESPAAVVALAKVANTPDTDATPALLTNAFAALVLSPPAELDDPANELEVVIATTPLQDGRIERIRVVEVLRFAVTDGEASALLLSFASPSSAGATPLANARETSLPRAIQEHGGDLTAALVALGLVDAAGVPGPTPELRSAIEAQRLPSRQAVGGNPPDGPRPRKPWWCYIFSCQ